MQKNHQNNENPCTCEIFFVILHAFMGFLCFIKIHNALLRVEKRKLITYNTNRIKNEKVFVERIANRNKHWRNGTRRSGIDNHRR